MRDNDGLYWNEERKVLSCGNSVNKLGLREWREGGGSGGAGISVLEGFKGGNVMERDLP